ncbi:MAG TPA: class I SAM-dependent methyltransferase [Steroidobacteraceae bacterium]
MKLRADTFAAMFQRMDRLDRPVVIVETGCTRTPGNWGGDGNSTVLFDRYAQTHPGSRVFTVDIDARATAACRALVSEHVSIHTGDSVKYLQSLAAGSPGQLDLLYLDSFDLDHGNPVPSAVHHLMELAAIAPALRPDTMVVVDDAFMTLHGVHAAAGQFVAIRPPTIDGKARFVAEYAARIEAELIFSGYQCGWIKMKPQH